ncbi:SMP-30/gluconolactonase/LRE family protein [Arthrobacter sp. StoSoilB5]|uniref:SMP-30/gluconolactonase/LRE family protein n=1 Tax=Arthrobacter sp. StoSoilB5 TaxID=2830992 RepID=UPI001CC6A1BE|nr:SMP-30/gluconolactonase/LRE family protein [Arthrobacter sp. StoSoilB5]
MSVVPAAIVIILALSSCTAAAPSLSTEAPIPSKETATELLRATSVHEATGMTLLEGPTVGPDGDLYIVDVTAPAGSPKVIAIDPGSREQRSVYTDNTSAFTSAQFSPLDGRLYLTDFLGSIVSITADGKDPRVFFSGPVGGAPMNPDDISFDQAGNLYITDSTGAQDPYWKPQGRLVRIDGRTAEATVLAHGLPAPNGLAFTPGFDGLWVSHNTANRIDYLRLSENGREVKTAHPAIHVSAGIGQVDSLAVDADGNLYVGFHNQAAIFVYDTAGGHISTISIPTEGNGLSSATNIAIAPGTTDGYVTVSGNEGGWIYTFRSLAKGIRQSNGG